MHDLPKSSSFNSLRASLLSFFNCRSISWFIRFCSFSSSVKQHAILKQRYLRPDYSGANFQIRCACVFSSPPSFLPLVQTTTRVGKDVQITAILRRRLSKIPNHEGAKWSQTDLGVVS